jgi:hypothetical protein
MLPLPTTKIPYRSWITTRNCLEKLHRRHIESGRAVRRFTHSAPIRGVIHRKELQNGARWQAGRPMNDRRWATGRRLHPTEIIGIFLGLFRRLASDETNLQGNETILPFGAELWKRRMVIKAATTTAGNAGGHIWRQSNADSQLHPCHGLCDSWTVDRRFAR